MRNVTALVMLAALLLGFGVQAQAEPLVSIVFSGNSWGYLKPCPT